MVAVAHLDIDGSRFSLDNISGTWERRFRVTGIEATVPEAIYAEIMGVLPQQAEPAGAPYAGLLVTTRTVERVVGEPNAATSQAEGVISYQVPNSSSNAAPPVDDDGDVLSISVQSFTENVETETAVNPSTGVPVRITVQDSDGLTRGARIVISKSRARVTAVRKETQYPKTRIDTYTNAINLGTWNGYPDGTVRCESVNADSVSGGNDWDVQYVFIVRPEGWKDIEVVGDDLATGKPIANPTGTQIKTYTHYLYQNFDPLNINFV